MSVGGDRGLPTVNQLGSIGPVGRSVRRKPTPEKGFIMNSETLFDSFDIEELEVLEVSDTVALPEMGASSGDTACCSSSSSSSSCCCC
jgi:thiazolylpeptide-type bacteriocin precursor